MKCFLVRVEPGRVTAGEVGSAATSSAVCWPHDALRSLLAPAPGVALPGRDAQVSAREAEAGRLLHRALRGPVSERLARFLGGPGPRAVLVEGGSELPWELLSDGSGKGLEASGQALVARLLPGRPPRDVPPSADLRVGLWATEEDPASRAMAESLRGLGAADGVGGLMHLVCHGDRAPEALLELARAGLSPHSVGHQLATQLEQAGLVVLDVCLSGSGRGDLVEAVLASGCGGCVAPRGPLSLPALGRFAEALGDSLREGAAVAEAVQAGRQAVRALASPRPEGRWHRMSLFLTHPAVLSRVLVDPRWSPRGWGPLEPDARALLDDALALAEHGYLGVEHLARALSSRERSVGRTDLPPVPELQVGDGAMRLSVRLQRWTWSAEVGRADLVQRTVSALDDWLSAPERVPRPGGTTLELPAGPAGDAAPLARRLMVLGGPEDGRVLVPAVGQSIGRWAESGPDLALYRDTPCWDPYLSRRHLLWQGEGRVRWLRPGHHLRGDRTLGDERVRHGDRLHPSPGTTLLALAAEQG